MVEKKPTYLRLSADLRQKVEELAESRSAQFADVIADLVNRGLAYDDLLVQHEAIRRREQDLRMDLQRAQDGKVATERQLRAAQQAISRLQWFINVPIATCKGCGAVATVEHVAAKRCPGNRSVPDCLSGAFNLLPQYRGSNGALELIGGLAALVGGVVIVGAISEALSGGPNDERRR